MKGCVQMNAWFRISRLIFKLLVSACLFFIGAFIGATTVADWKLIAIVSVVATAVITAVWFIGKLSAGEYETTDEDGE